MYMMVSTMDFISTEIIDEVALLQNFSELESFTLFIEKKPLRLIISRKHDAIHLLFLILRFLNKF